ncbi:MAG: hypothetical protein FJY37_17050 [Betaproteobacteria bacterium]|nr:hypothetical protein [Betaproteobacteria bacterium]
MERRVISTSRPRAPSRSSSTVAAGQGVAGGRGACRRWAGLTMTHYDQCRRGRRHDRQSDASSSAMNVADAGQAPRNSADAISAAGASRRSRISKPSSSN